MTDLRQAAQQALDWLYENDIVHPTKVSQDLRTALKQQAEPVGFMYPDDYSRMLRTKSYSTVYPVEAGNAAFGYSTIKLYTTPPQRKPLTIAEVEQILAQHNYEIHGDRARYIVRMTEEAHNIKEGS